MTGCGKPPAEMSTRELANCIAALGDELRRRDGTPSAGSVISRARPATLPPLRRSVTCGFAVRLRNHAAPDPVSETR